MYDANDEVMSCVSLLICVSQTFKLYLRDGVELCLSYIIVLNVDCIVSLILSHVILINVEFDLSFQTS